jgi:hypothetical protein
MPMRLLRLSVFVFILQCLFLSVHAEPACRAKIEVVDAGQRMGHTDNGTEYTVTYMNFTVLENDAPTGCIVRSGQSYKTSQPNIFKKGDMLWAKVDIRTMKQAYGESSYLYWYDITYEDGNEVPTPYGPAYVLSFNTVMPDPNTVNLNVSETEPTRLSAGQQPKHSLTAYYILFMVAMAIATTVLYYLWSKSAKRKS